jgi:Spy/CpxP family protein refolding chaperone
MKKYIITLLVFVLALSLASCFRGGRGHHKYVTKKLDLTAEQQQKLESSMEEYKSLWKESKKIMEEMKEIVALEVQKDAIDKEALSQSLQNKMNQISEMIPGYVDIFAEFHAGLDAPQKAKLADFVKEHKGKKHRRGHHKKKDHDDDDDNDN